MPNNAPRRLLLIVLVYQLLLVGCSTSSIRPNSDPLAQRLQQLYHLAKQSDPKTSATYRVEASDLLSQQQRFNEAETILEGISQQNLSNQARATYAIVQAEISLARFDGKTALSNLNQHSRVLRQKHHQLRSSLLRARSFDLLERHLDSARERINLAPLLTTHKAKENRTSLWKALIKTPTEQLQQATKASRNSNEQGWLSLALLTQTNSNNLDQQFSALQRWLQRWPTHPATLNLPQELALLERIISERPNNIVLMLPLQGKNSVAGKAIRNGFMAAYYEAKAAGDQTPKIRIIDTSNNTDFRALYNKASLQGADFIIGPLEKQHVQTLQNSGPLTTPTLALNYSSQDISTKQLYQFGLSAEDQARQTAEKAWLSGHKNSLVLTPSTNWGKRITKAFSDQWETLGGTILETAHFNEAKDYSSAIEELFDLNSSKQRAEQLRKILASNIEFTARRRSDVDFIFVAATPKQARQINPTLAFHFAGNVPVYATSHIYSGIENTLLNRDLDGIIFAETPWLLSHKNSPIKKSIADNWPANAGRLARLYALGVDAYQLYPRIQLLSNNQKNTLAGTTGLLTLDETGRVVRTLEWAHIKYGRIKPLL